MGWFDASNQSSNQSFDYQIEEFNKADVLEINK